AARRPGGHRARRAAGRLPARARRMVPRPAGELRAREVDVPPRPAGRARRHPGCQPADRSRGVRPVLVEPDEAARACAPGWWQPQGPELAPGDGGADDQRDLRPADPDLVRPSPGAQPMRVAAALALAVSFEARALAHGGAHVPAGP